LLKDGKSPGVDNIPAEILKHGGPVIIDALTVVCQKIWTTGQWPKDWTKSLIIPLPKKGNTRLCQNYRTISLICHPSKVMLRVILNRLVHQAEQILEEEQAGFRAQRSTTEQIFNLRLLVEKHLEHQKELYHNFIDFKKAFDRVWHEGLWRVLKEYNIDNQLIEVIKSLYDEATSAVLLNGNAGDFFPMTVGVRQGCPLSPVLFNIFLEKIMQKALTPMHSSVNDCFADEAGETDTSLSSVSIGGRPLCNLRFADDIDLLGSSEEELQQLTRRLEETAAEYGMEISSEKSKILVNSTKPRPSTNIQMNGQTLEEVDQFKYLGSTQTKDGTSVKEVKIRLAQAHSAMARLAILWKNKAISFPTKIVLYRSLVLSVLLYGCESWTLTADLERRIQAFENKCFRRMLGISYREHKTNEYVWQQVSILAGPQELLLSTVKRRKLSWFGHVCRHDALPKIILQGTVDGKRRRGRPRKSWRDNIKEWTGQSMSSLLRVAEDRRRWAAVTAEASVGVPQRRLGVTGFD
jgi:hypothetical protein